MKLRAGDELEVIDQENHARIRVRESLGPPVGRIKASALLSWRELEAHAAACLELARTIKERGY